MKARLFENSKIVPVFSADIIFILKMRNQNNEKMTEMFI